MWTDNETTTDFLGFKVHSELIRDVVTDSAILPIVMGVFGDWGGGKSSIMKMLERDLESDKDIVCLYFNGWMFEGYEDAKTALLSSILLQLGEHKHFGSKVKEKVVGLLKRIKWMEIARLGVKHVGVPLATGLLTGGATTLPTLAASLVPSMLGSSETEACKESEDTEDTNWLELINTDSSKPDLLEIRKFRQDFEKLLAETNIKSLIILIDDLDRCLPERIIETLEAIKLFVAVPKTAFVIGADPRIVRHAIAMRYVARQLRDESSSRQDEYDLVTDYLEKLIQIPYYLPRLSPAEIETYINLLLCQKYLEQEKCSVLLNHWSSKRSNNFYAAYRYSAIKEALGDGAISSDLEQQLAWSNAISQVITEGLKGNPRQVKRMLNAMLLRVKLAKVAGMSIRSEVLAKLMVLEYTHIQLFQELNKWQTIDSGYPKNIKLLEEAALTGDSETTSTDDGLKEWRTVSLQNWLRMQPPLSDIDLRDYFWLARDRTSATLSGVTMVSPLVRRLFVQLIDDNKGEQQLAAREAVNLDENEREALLHLLQQQVERHPDRDTGPEALSLLVEQKLDGAAPTLFKALRNASVSNVTPSVAFKLQSLAKINLDLKQEVIPLLEYLKNAKATKVGKAAEKVLAGWN